MAIARTSRVAWTVVSIVIFETITLALAVLPAYVVWTWPLTWLPASATLVRPAAVALMLVPGYLVFAVTLCAVSAMGTRLLGWRTPPPGEWRIRDMEWPVLNWSRAMMATHLVRVLVGTLMRTSPIWTWYLRWNGASIGRGVYVGSVSISDHNMLEFSDGVIIGEGVHLSGHTVEGGVVKTGRVRLGRFVTVGLDSVVGIDVEVGEGAQIGALSVVPKHIRLEAGVTYAGAPVAPVHR